MARYTPDEFARVQEMRAKKLRDSIPRSFAQGVRKAHQIDKEQLRRDVYSGGKAHSKSSTLLKSEVLVRQGSTEALITNRAQTLTGEYYAWPIHDGVPALSAPTGGGKSAYVWLADPLAPRPRSAGAWKAARRRGLVIFARNIRARPKRPWRTRCMQSMMQVIMRGIQAEQARAKSSGV